MTRVVRSRLAPALVLLAVFGMSCGGPGATPPPVSESDGPVSSAAPRVSPAGPSGTPEPTDGSASGAAVRAVAETDPVRSSRDAADDAAIWVNAADPAGSLIIGTDKRTAAGLVVYDLAGREVAQVSDGPMNNVDLRDGFPLGGREVTLVTASDREANTLAIYAVDPQGPSLVEVAGSAIESAARVYGTCMYRSQTGAVYAFLTDLDGVVEQWELSAVADGVEGRLVRTLKLDSRTEGCAADDELGWLYVGEEKGGVWRYPAEPSPDDQPVLVDATQPDGHLVDDVEGVAIAVGPEGAGYLIVSSQGEDRFAVYERQPPNSYVTEFAIGGSETIDEVTHTDGIEVTTAALGEPFTAGLFVAQDDKNPGANQNFKLVRWADILASIER
jgi:3-phytase